MALILGLLQASNEGSLLQQIGPTCTILDNPVDITLHIRGLVIARRSRATPLQAQLDYMYGTKVEIKALHDCVGGIKKFFTDKIQEQMDAASTNGSPGDTILLNVPPCHLLLHPSHVAIAKLVTRLCKV